MKKIRPISGFPEWLPEQKIIEQRFIDHLRAKFEQFGFTPIETRSVEPLDQLLKKGETDKEIYVLRRLQAEDDQPDKNLGLHFDLTVPFSRYVDQFRGRLSFPFKRYQIQRSWRGERPQEGRYREFYQADIDVVDERELSLHFDAEMPRLLHMVLSSLPIPPVRISINNRKILQGFFQGLGAPVAETVRAIDKLDKIGEEGVAKLLGANGLDDGQVELCLKLAAIRGEDAATVERVRELGVDHPLLEQGLEELAFVLGQLEDLPKGSALADLHIARGLDYYTGTIYEGVMTDFPALGSVCSGGRYDNLAGANASVKLPGVGVSIGVSRILGFLFSRDMLRASRKTPTCALVALVSEDTRRLSNHIGRALWARGLNCEVFHKPAKFGKQIRYADGKGIPYVIFPNIESPDNPQVRDIRSGEQKSVSIHDWEPPAEDRSPQIQLKEKTED